MRVVIDTGVFVSAAIKAQTVLNIAVYQAAQHGVLLKSDVTAAELMEVSATITPQPMLAARLRSTPIL